MARLYRRGEIWWLRWYHGGRFFYRSCKTRNRRVAQFEKATLEQRLLSSRRFRHASDGLVSDALEAYRLVCEVRKTPHSHLTDVLRLKKFGAAFGPRRLSQLTPVAIEQFLAGLTYRRPDGSQSPIAPATRNHYLKLLRAFGAWCVERGYCFENLTAGIARIKITTRSRIWLTRAQRAQFLLLAKRQSAHHYPMIATALYAGLRYGELQHLEWADVDFEANVIRVRPKVGWAPKNKTGRMVPLHPALRKILWSIRRPDGICFTTPPDALRNPGAAYRSDPRAQILRRLFSAVGLEGPGRSWHALRHTFASNLVQHGVSVYKVCEWLGHRDVRTTQIYAHLVQGFDRDIARL